jgi:glycosyltransferase involved in cell wall biosynthesis
MQHWVEEGDTMGGSTRSACPPSGAKPRYSVVVPVFNSESVVATTVSNTVNFFTTAGHDYELVLVNDGSKDRSWEIVKSLAKRNRRIKAINLVKNYGQHAAVLCGFRHASGDYVITMDDDMQNPPEEIAHLIRKIDEGYDAVFGKVTIKHHPLIRRLGSKLVGYLHTKVFGKPKDISLTNFRIIRRSVVRRILQYKTHYPYIPGLILMFAGTLANVPVEHRERLHGKSNYTAERIARLMLTLLFSYSSYPLRLLSATSFFVSFISFSVGVFFLLKALLVGSRVQGWSSLVVLIAFFNCFTTVLLGMFGEYLWRIMNQASGGRSYYVKEFVGDEGD